MVQVTLGFVPTFRSRYTDWVQKMRDDSLATFAKIKGLEIVVPEASPDDNTIDAEAGLTPHGMVQNLDDAEAVAEFFARKHVDGLIICPLDFGDERSSVKIAEKLGVPVLLYATKEPPAMDHPGLMRVSDSYCGNLAVASALYRRKLRYHYAGIFFPDEPELLAEVDTFCRAIAVVKGLTNARIGQVGVRPPTFETVGYDEVAMVRKFKQNVIYANLSDITDRALALADDDPDVTAVIDDIRGSVAEITVGDKYIINAAKFEVALKEFWTANKLSAAAVQCWPSISRLMGISLCAVYGRMTNQHLLTACETDTVGTLAMMSTYFAAMGETLPHFVDWTIQHRENPNWLMAWHCGNAPVSLAADPAKTALRSRMNMIGEGEPPEDDPMAGLFQFQIKPGKVTFCRLAEYDDQWKMLITSGDIVPSDETLAGNWSWVEVKDHAKLYRTLVEQGFIHHASMIHGDLRAALEMACKFMDIEAVVVE